MSHNNTTNSLKTCLMINLLKSRHKFVVRRRFQNRRSNGSCWFSQKQQSVYVHFVYSHVVTDTNILLCFINALENAPPKGDVTCPFPLTHQSVPSAACCSSLIGSRGRAQPTPNLKSPSVSSQTSVTYAKCSSADRPCSRPGGARCHGAETRTRRAERRVRRLPRRLQVVRHGGDSRGPGAGAVEVYGRGAADLSVHHVQADRAGEACRK